ncbi:MAG: hypothetical protein AB1489_13965 [Acidobacteriota bacterium]
MGEIFIGPDMNIINKNRNNKKLARMMRRSKVVLKSVKAEEESIKKTTEIGNESEQLLSNKTEG